MTLRKYCQITDTERTDIQRGGELLRLMFSEHAKVLKQRQAGETSVSSSTVESKQAEEGKNDDDEEGENGIWDPIWGVPSQNSCESPTPNISNHSDALTPSARARIDLVKEMDDWMHLKIDWLSLYPDLHPKRKKNVFYMNQQIDPLDW
eukprot:CAMPEP_0184009010 /NCGR_PEP_ID=MMETSP0954-20121128/2336_1 /TAXON_ID=627963 /ORGANISM="Aplanochytrium sp, Strain PBS07" /LENGTH=148 /DNA_ID=CAMNT_0026288273 /DNA_START=256 /DNA_END=699 /DNA_ORIENTATION=+